MKGFHLNVDGVDGKLRELLKESLDHTLSLPESVYEGILFILYCVKRISIFKLMKILAISHLKLRIPYSLRLVVGHFGLLTPSLHKYVRLMVEEGFVKIVDGESLEGKRRRYYELTENGRRYVATTILPWEDVSYYEKGLAFLLSLPTSSLIEYSNYVANFSKEGANGPHAVLRAAFLEDFRDPKFQSPRCRIVINSLLAAYRTIRKMFDGSLVNAPHFDINSFSAEKAIAEKFEDVLVKRRPTHCRSHLIELKNSVLNRFLYLLAIYIINILDRRPAALEEIKCMTHDHYLDAYRNLLFEKYLPDEEKKRYKRQKKLSNKRIQRDIDLLLRSGFLKSEKPNDAHYYVVTATTFVNNGDKLYLPDPEWLKETFEIFNDENTFLEHRLNALRRGYPGH